MVTHTLSLSDNLGIDAVVPQKVTFYQFDGETIGFSDAVLRLANGNRSIAESLGITDAVSRLANADRTLSESVAFSDAFSRIAHGNRIVEDNVAFSDAFTVSVPGTTQTISVSDSIGLSESSSGSEDVTSETSDGYADGFSLDFSSVGPTLQAGENTATPVNLWTVFDITPRNGDTINSAKLTLTAGASDSNTVNLQLKIRSVSSAAPPTDYTDYSTKLGGSFTSTVNWQITGSATVDSTTYESPELSTILQAHLDAFSSFDGTLELWVVENTGVGSSGVRTFRSADHTSGKPSLNVNYTLAGGGVQRIAHGNRDPAESLGLSDSVSRIANALRIVEDSLGISTVFTVGTGATVKSVSLSNSLGVSDSVARVADNLRAISDSIAFQDELYRAGEAFRIATDSIAIADSVNVFGGAGALFEVTVTDSLAIADSVQRIADALRNISDNLGITIVTGVGHIIPLTNPDNIGLSAPTFTDTSFTVPSFTDVSLGTATFTDISLTVAETQGMLHILEQDQIYEATTGDFDAIVRDEDGAAIAQASLTTITLTLRNYKTGEIINSRNAQNVNNTNDVTIDSSGNLLWLIQEEDTVIFDESLEFGDKEEHVAEFVYTYSSGAKTGRVYYTFEVIRKMKSLV